MKIPEIDLKIQSYPVQAQTRKLKARWSIETERDLWAYHSIFGRHFKQMKQIDLFEEKEE